MSNELPDLDEDVSFVVDEGAPVGPMPLRSIIDSIRSGDRAPDVLVWWAGASDWVSFAGEAELFALLQELPATNQPPPPPAELVFSEPEKPSFAEPEITSFDRSTTESDLEEDHSEEPEFDLVAEAEADMLLARDSRAMHPSTGWGLAVDDEFEAEDELEVEAEDQVEVEVDLVDELEVEDQVEVGADEVGDSEHGQDVAATDADEVIEEGEAITAPARVSDFEDLAAMAPGGDDSPVRAPGLSGLFAAPSRADAGLIGIDSPRDDVDVGEAARLSLETVGARIDALTSATRRTQQQFGLRHDREHPEDFAALDAQDLDAEPVTQPETEFSSGSWQAVDVPDLDQRFAEMAKASVERQRRLDWALRIDELLLSACITAVVDSGFVLLDLATKERDHRALFDHNDDSRRVRLEISPLSPLNAAGDPIGRHVRVSMAWGREVADADAASEIVRSQRSNEEVEPGSFTCEMNMISSSASTCVNLIWTADEFVHDDRNVDRAALNASIAAILHALEQRWHELFVASH